MSLARTKPAESSRPHNFKCSPAKRPAQTRCAIRLAMSRNRIFFAAIFSALALLSNYAVLSRAQTLAATPPMGWNSWDAYGLTIDEADFRANTTVLAGVAKYGWKYAVIDEGWYMARPVRQDAGGQEISLGSERPADSRTEPLPFFGKQRRLQAAGRLGARAGAQVRHSHRPRNSQAGG